jgi:hypothetical protein
MVLTIRWVTGAAQHGLAAYLIRGEGEFCGIVRPPMLWIRTFFSDSDPQIFFWILILFRVRYRIRILVLIFWPEFFKLCLSLLSFVFWNLYDRKKTFPLKNVRFFVFQVFDLQLSGSESKSGFFFGFRFGSSQNIRIISDCDPQHCRLPSGQEWQSWTQCLILYLLKIKSINIFVENMFFFLKNAKNFKQ